MFTLVICLVVVALSGAAVLHISLADQSKGATRRPRQPRGPDHRSRPGPSGTAVPPVAPPAARLEDDIAVAPITEVEVEPAVRPKPGPEPGSGPKPEVQARPLPERTDSPASAATVVIAVHRARSASLLVLLLTVLGSALALVVALAALVAVIALRSALVG